MSRGTIREYDPQRGFGVIVDLETERPLTFYANYVVLKEGEVLKKGQEVEYKVEQERHRSEAVNVRIV